MCRRYRKSRHVDVAARILIYEPAHERSEKKCDDVRVFRPLWASPAGPVDHEAAVGARRASGGFRRIGAVETES